MPQPPWIDIAKVAAAWFVTTALVLIGILGSRPSRIPRTVFTAFVIAARLLFVYGVTFAIFWGCLGIPVNVLLIVSGIVLVLSALARLDLDFVVSDGAVGAALILMFMVPVYILKQFVLGFPDHDEIVLTPPEEAARNEPPQITSKLGTVTATLRPWGKVEVAGTTYSATSADGKLLDPGVAVRITEVRGNVLVVMAVEST